MARGGQQVPLVCHGHSRPIVEITYSTITGDGYFLMSASKDGKPMIRDGETGDWIGTFEGHKGAVWSSCLNYPATHAVTGSADFSARVWNALTGDELYSFQHKHIVRTVDFSQDSYYILTGGMEKIIRLFDLSKPEAEPLVMEGSPSGIRCGLWLDNNTILSSCSDTNGIRLWDTRSLSIVKTIDTPNPVTDIEISADGQTMTTTDGKDVKFWDVKSFGVTKTHTMEYETESASLHPQNGKFVAAGVDMWVRQFDFETGEELDCNKGHHGPVHCVRYAPDGESYASGSEDGTIRIWCTNFNADDASEPPSATKERPSVEAAERDNNIPIPANT